MDWIACKKGQIAKEVRPDKNLAKSLMASSDRKMKSQALLKMDDDTAESKITLAYDALRELLEALAIMKGYKIYNHECYTYFLKEILGESQTGDKFDQLRKTRNRINYYGMHVRTPEAKQAISEIVELTDQIKKKFFSATARPS